MRLGQDPAGNPLPLPRFRRDAAVGLARSPEAESVGGDAVDDEFLFRERHEVDIRDQLVRLEQVAQRLVRACNREALDQDFAVSQIEMEPLDLDFRPEQLRADLLRFPPRDRIGEHPPQYTRDHQQNQQRSDRLPPEDLDPHGRNIL